MTNKERMALCQKQTFNTKKARKWSKPQAQKVDVRTHRQKILDAAATRCNIAFDHIKKFDRPFTRSDLARVLKITYSKTQAVVDNLRRRGLIDIINLGKVPTLWDTEYRIQHPLEAKAKVVENAVDTRNQKEKDWTEWKAGLAIKTPTRCYCRKCGETTDKCDCEAS